jgi:hypothetical protein
MGNHRWIANHHRAINNINIISTIHYLPTYLYYLIFHKSLLNMRSYRNDEVLLY